MAQKQKKKYDTEEFFAEARKRLSDGYDTEAIEAAKEDLEFAYVPGKQWDDDVKRQRAGRPALEYNKIPSFISRVKNTMRMNRYSIRVRPKGEGSNKKIADILSGKIRDIENASDCEEYQDTAGQTSAACGRGFIEVGIRYEADESFNRELYIEPIPDYSAVVWDPSARQPDLQDGGWIFVTQGMSVDDFKAKYPDIEPISVSVTDGGAFRQGDQVKVAKYFFRGDEKSRKLIKIRLRTADGNEEIKDVWEDDVNDLIGSAENLVGIEIVTDDDGNEITRTVKTRPWMRAVINGVEFIESPKEWDFRYHPIVPIWGERIWIDGKFVTWGMVRFVKDAAKSRNYARTAMIERLALEPKAPWVAGKNQIAGHEEAYKMSRSQNVDLLVYNDDPSETNAVGPPQRNFPDAPNQAAMLISNMDDADMHDIVGIPWGAVKQGPEIAGVAISQRRVEADIATFVYPDEMAKGMKRLGRILVDYLPKIYDTARQIRVRGLDNSESMVPINASGAMFPDKYRGPKVPGPTIQGTQIFNDLSAGTYDVVVDVGPQFVTLREETLNRMEQFIAKYPAAFPLIGDLIAKLQDIPEAEMFEKRLRSLVPPDLREPEEGEEEKPPKPQAPDPKLLEVLNKMEIATREQDRKEFETLLEGIKKLMESESIREGIQLPAAIALIDQLLQKYSGPPPGRAQGMMSPVGGPGPMPGMGQMPQPPPGPPGAFPGGNPGIPGYQGG